ncbi:unnamed protein product [Rhizoctonia solani]|uniref:Uncharacterized protein n=1 Tax=Rhizoctonia solani TaxID=456999 RepID=A0A8H3AEW7_9AGAM|nr:unnamed protein product [Rhizoctonia solani]
MLFEKLRDQLPAGSAQNYAAMLVLNHLESYSKKCGLQMEDRDRLAIASLSLEFLYMAWYNDVGLELSERQLESWPLHVWKNSSNLGINLRSLVKHPNLRLIHGRLRDVRTLLSFGAVVNRYYELIQLQDGGLDAFVRTYQPAEPHVWNSSLPSSAFTGPLRPGTYATNSSTGAGNCAWNWLPWGSEKSSKMPLLKPLEVPGSIPSPPAEVIPLYVSEKAVHFHLVTRQANSSSSSVIPSRDSGTISSSATNESIATTQISALERLESYLSVLGTPQCEPVRLQPVSKPRLLSLKEAEETAQVRTLQEPIRKPIQLPLAPLTTTTQMGLPGIPNITPIRPLRWMTREELKSRSVTRKPVGYRLEVLKGNKKLPKLRFDLPKTAISNATNSRVIIVDAGGSEDQLPEASPLNIVKKDLEKRLLRLRRGGR